MRRQPLPRRTVAELTSRRNEPVALEALRVAADIVAHVEAEGEPAVRRYAERFGDLETDVDLFRDAAVLAQAWKDLSAEERSRLERTAARIRAFADAQRQALHDVCIPIPGGLAGHTVAPVERAGCYAPGGRYPLPSSALMTVITARVAGVRDVWLASPRPGKFTLAAAHVAGADGVLTIGGPHAIAARPTRGFE